MPGLYAPASTPEYQRAVGDLPYQQLNTVRLETSLPNVLGRLRQGLRSETSSEVHYLRGEIVTGDPGDLFVTYGRVSTPTDSWEQPQLSIVPPNAGQTVVSLSGGRAFTTIAPASESQSTPNPVQSFDTGVSVPAVPTTAEAAPVGEESPSFISDPDPNRFPVVGGFVVPVTVDQGGEVAVYSDPGDFYGSGQYDPLPPVGATANEPLPPEAGIPPIGPPGFITNPWYDYSGYASGDFGGF